MQDLKTMPTPQVLGVAIVLKKKEMIDLGMTHGLTDVRTVQCSQQLDHLLNLYTGNKNFGMTG